MRADRQLPDEAVEAADHLVGVVAHLRNGGKVRRELARIDRALAERVEVKEPCPSRSNTAAKPSVALPDECGAPTAPTNCGSDVKPACVDARSAGAGITSGNMANAVPAKALFVSQRLPRNTLQPT